MPASKIGNSRSRVVDTAVLVFSVPVSDTDNHLRNHGFLYADPDGWALSPAYDLNPIPVDVKPQVLSITIDVDDQTASIKLVFEVAPYFEFADQTARKIARSVADVVAIWRNEAGELGFSHAACERMNTALQHDDQRTAGAT